VKAGGAEAIVVHSPYISGSNYQNFLILRRRTEREAKNVITGCLAGSSEKKKKITEARKRE